MLICIYVKKFTKKCIGNISNIYQNRKKLNKYNKDDNIYKYKAQKYRIKNVSLDLKTAELN